MHLNTNLITLIKFCCSLKVFFLPHLSRCCRRRRGYLVLARSLVTHTYTNADKYTHLYRLCSSRIPSNFNFVILLVVELCINRLLLPSAGCSIAGSSHTEYAEWKNRCISRCDIAKPASRQAGNQRRGTEFCVCVCLLCESG